MKHPQRKVALSLSASFYDWQKLQCLVFRIDIAVLTFDFETSERCCDWQVLPATADSEHSA